MRKVLGSLVSLLFVASGLALVGPAGPALASCEGGSTLPSLKVQMRAERARYGLGDMARVHVTVTRAVDGRDLGPVQGADVMVGLSSKDTALYGGAVSDADGRALVKIRIAKYAQLGPADAYAIATNEIANGPCLRISESGQQKKKRLLTIVL